MGEPARVFVSYSHKDKKIREQLERFLEPLQREGRIEWWADTRIEQGDRWREEIEKALAVAKVAVLLVTQDFVASTYITNDEMPVLLARAAQDQLRLLPVFVGPSMVEIVSYRFIGADDKEQTTHLSEVQGYGSPGSPLDTWSDRERAFVKLAKQLHRAVSVDAAPASPPLVKTRAAGRSRAVDQRPAQQYEYRLILHLQRSGDQVHVTPSLPGHEPMPSVTRSLSSSEDGGESVLAIADRLDTANRPSLVGLCTEAAVGCGDALFRLLFGTKRVWGSVLRQVFNRFEPDPQPNPIYSGVRLVIATDDAMLAGLPWRLIAWRRHLLVERGWVISTTTAPQLSGNHVTQAPFEVLAVVPAASGESPEYHLQAINRVLQDVWPDRKAHDQVQLASTRKQLENRLSGMRPHLLMVFCRGLLKGGRPVLLLDGDKGGEEQLPLTRLGRMLEGNGHHPGVIYLNTEGMTDAGTALPHVIGQTAPLVLWRRLPEWQPNSLSIATAWLRHWLTTGQDPVTAFHTLEGWELTESPELATVAIEAGFETWTTRRYRPDQVRPPIHLHLDRRDLKGRAVMELQELVRSDSRRVQVFVAYGENGNAITAVGEQLVESARLDAGDVAAVTRKSLQLPAQRSDLRSGLEHELRLQLEADPNERLRFLLRRCGPQSLRTGQRPVLWLDWGACGVGDDLQPMLEDQHLADWIAFCSAVLTAHCPDDLRIVSSLAIEVSLSHHKRLDNLLQKQRRQPWARTPAFRMTTLRPLETVSEQDLFDFLEEPANTSCEPALHEEVARRLIERTGGRFEETVALMEQAEQSSWQALLIDLRREQGE